MPTVTVNIRPQPKPQTAKALRYDSPRSKRYRQYKRNLQWLFAAEGLKHLPESLHITFTFAAPKSDPNRSGVHQQKPDLDNLVKAVLDALAGKGGDDSHVHFIAADKRWGSKDEIEIIY